MAQPPIYGHGPAALVLIGDTIAEGGDGKELGEVLYVHARGDIGLRRPTGYRLAKAADVRLVRRGQP
jgi:replication-associated recombination protein RarA